MAKLGRVGDDEEAQLDKERRRLVRRVMKLEVAARAHVKERAAWEVMSARMGAFRNRIEELERENRALEEVNGALRVKLAGAAPTPAEFVRQVAVMIARAMEKEGGGR